MSAPNTTLSESESPKVNVPPLNVELPVTVRSPPTPRLPLISAAPLISILVAVRSISLEEIDI